MWQPLLATVFAAPQAQAQVSPSVINAADFTKWSIQTATTNIAASPATFTVRGNGYVASPQGFTFTPFVAGAVVAIEAAGSTAENLTIISSSCPTNSLENTCTFTANATYVHFAGAQIRSGDAGVSAARAALPQGTPILVEVTTLADMANGTSGVVTLSSAIPANVLFLGASATLVKAESSTYTWKMGITSHDAIFGTGLNGQTLGTRADYATYSSAGAYVGIMNNSAVNILITASNTGDTVGQWQVTVTYITL